MQGIVKKTAVILACAGIAAVSEPSYDRLNQFLSTYVCPEGVVYSKIAGDPLIDSITTELASLNEETFRALSTEAQIAYLINVYNFHTVALIVRNYPLSEGIKDIDRPWNTDFVPLFGEEVSLDHIEHEVIREEYEEPRIHFALNCASESCPKLRSEAYTGEKLDSQLEEEAVTFLTDTTLNRVDGNTLYLSRIFDWYGSDFDERYGGYVEYVKKVLDLSGSYKVRFREYNWSLNEASSCPKE